MVVLATKVYVAGDARERALQSLRTLVDDVIGDLAVEVTIGVRRDEFPSVTIQGEDEVVARAALREEWGEITPNLRTGDTYVGTLEQWDEDGFYVDAGQRILIPTAHLGLGPGRPAQLVDRYGLVQHQRLEFVYDSPSRLADAAHDRLYGFRRDTGRITINSVTRGEVHATVNRAGHANDIVTIDRLGLLEQSIVCKPGTDPPGLLAALGPYLPGEMRCIVS